MTTLIQQQTDELTGTWAVDPVHSALTFSVRHMKVATFRGSFSEFTGQLVVNESGASIAGTVDVASVVTADGNLYGHLQTAEFFDSERHPQLSFSGSTLERDGEHVRIEGELTIRGITRPAVFEGSLTGPVTDPYGNERVGLDISTTLDRTEFGLEWNAPLPGGGFVLSNDVRIDAHLALVQQ